MKYKARVDFVSPIISGILLIFFILLFVLTGNLTMFFVFGGIGLLYFFLSTAPNFSFAEVENGVLSYHSFRKSWRINISDIAIICDLQGKGYLSNIGHGSMFLPPRGGYQNMGFALKTVSGNVLIAPFIVQNYQGLLSQLSASNPNMKISKVTEVFSQPTRG